MKKYTFLLIILLLLTTQFAKSQKHTISGEIKDKAGEALIGVNVIELQDGRIISGTISDIEGKYVLQIDDTCSLKFSLIGFTNKIVKITSGQTKLNVQLEESVVQIEEVAVEAYAPVIKKTVSGSVVSISPTEVSKRDISDRKSKRSKDKGKTKEVTSEGEPTSATNGIKSGSLTAGEVNDFAKWKLWNDITTADLRQYQSAWQMNPRKRFSLQITDEEGYPVIDQKAELCNGETILWTARTDNTGKAEFWTNIFLNDTTAYKNLTLRTDYKGKTFEITNAKQIEEGMNHLKLASALPFPTKADIAFVVDATGSMSDEIEYMKIELNDVIAKVKAQNKEIDLNLSSVFYRDAGDEYVIRSSELSGDIQKTIDFIQKQHAGGGGDFPEAADSALSVAINSFAWNATARARILFLVLDAPPHYEAEHVAKMQKLAKLAAEKGIRIVPVAGSGIDKSTEFLMRSLALATNGTYTFLTDDSGIGDSHIKPSTDKWEVEFLNGLLVRLSNQYLYVPKIKKNKKNTMNDSIVNTFSENTLINQNNGIASADSSGTQQQDENLDPKKFKFDLKIYPNPTQGELNIELKKEVKELYLCDVSGKIMEKYIPENDEKLTIDIGNYPSGIYFLKYPFMGKWKAGKIILVH